MTTYIEKGTKEFTKLNIALFLGGFTVFAVLYCMQPLIGPFMHTFEISETKASLALSVSTLALAFSLLFYGAFSETYGRRSIMLWAVALVTLFSFAQPFVQNFEQLLVLRAIQGVLLGGLPAVAVAFISEEVHPSQIVSCISLFIAGNGLGAAIGRMSSAFITSYFGWRTALLVISCFVLVATILFFLLLPAARNFKSEPLRIKPVLIAYRSHLTNRKLIPLFMTGSILLASNVALFNFMGIHLMEQPYNWSEQVTGFIYATFLIGSISPIFINPLMARKGELWSKRFALLLFIGGVILTLVPSAILKIIGITLGIMAFFIGHSLASSAVGRIATHHKSQASSMYLLFYYIGSSVGGVLASYSWSLIGWTGVALFVGTILCCAFALTFSVQKEQSSEFSLLKLQENK